jgi:hypothetical protein
MADAGIYMLMTIYVTPSLFPFGESMHPAQILLGKD